MSLSLADLVADRRTITVAYKGHEVSVTYKPAAYTGEVARTGLPYLEFVVALVESWDLVDGDTPVAVDEETVGSLPQAFLKAVSVAIIGDASLGEAESS